MRTSLAAGLLLLLSACGHESEAIINNPAITGRVAGTPIFQHHGWAEHANGLPSGTMDDHAEMSAYDAEKICFLVTLAEVNERVQLQGMTAQLIVEPKSVKSAPVVIESEQTEHETYHWTERERREIGRESLCVRRNSYGRCRRWSTRTFYETVTVPGTSRVFRASTDVCFPNDGQLTARATQVGLQLSKSDDVYREFWWGFPALR